MRIRADQVSILHGLKCKRVRHLDRACLDSIEGPLVGGERTSTIADLFRSDEHIEDERSGALASYVITNGDDDILMFFSIRCGELFEKVDHEKMVLGHNALVGLLKLEDNNITQEEQNRAIEAVRTAVEAGLGIDDFRYYAKKKRIYLDDQIKEPNAEVSRVFNVYSGVELKFFGVNAKHADYWKSLGFPRRMGETLFWHFVIPKLEELQDVVGCQYLYLFAADQEADGSLVTYYKSVLHMDADPWLSSNKPVFDYNSMFLYQDISKLIGFKEAFFDDFNPDKEDNENV